MTDIDYSAALIAYKRATIALAAARFRAPVWDQATVRDAEQAVEAARVVLAEIVPPPPPRGTYWGKPTDPQKKEVKSCPTSSP
jgi:hypothetical protein